MAETRLQGQLIAFLVANEGIEQVELTEPWGAIAEAGGRPELLAPEPGRARAMHHLTLADEFEVDRTVGSADPASYAGIVLPGGVANPDRLRMDADAVAFVRSAFGSATPAAVICHGPWTLVEADLVRGRTLTSWPSLRTDIENAGGHWVDRQVVVCDDGPNRLVTSRKPDDLAAFCDMMLEAFSVSRKSSAPR